MSTATSTVVNVDFSGLVDELGLIKAQAADLKAREDAIKATLQDAGITTLEGKFFRVAISETHRAPKIDWEAIAAKLEPSHQLVTAHTHAQSSFTVVRVSARSTK
jgi:hypothetical protein|tara:strand:- start:6250 stop:6564 length:315 start_codon:yes stop_codon:yes gene_type:complete